MNHITRQPDIPYQHDQMFQLLKEIAVFCTDKNYAEQAMNLVQEINQENKQ
jgi:hypothetical protein